MRAGLRALWPLLLIAQPQAAVRAQVSSPQPPTTTSRPAEPPQAAAGLTLLDDSPAALIERFNAQAGKLRIVGVFAPG